jgi:Flp pilus assembly CpaF family ATPase
MALAIHLVVHIARIRGRRRVTEIVAVRGYDGEADRFLLESRLPQEVAREEVIV